MNATSRQAYDSDRVISSAIQILKDRLVKPGQEFFDGASAVKYLYLKLADLEHEVFGMLCLDIKNRLLEDVQLFRGTLKETAVATREVVKEALRTNAGAVVLYHNHPSGENQPTEADLKLTKELRKILRYVDIEVLDHIIIGGDKYYSFNEEEII